MTSDYELAKRVLNQCLEGLELQHKQVNDELRDMRNDPEKGKDCDEYRATLHFRRDVRQQINLLETILSTIDEDVRKLAQEEAGEMYPIRRWIADDGMPYDHWDSERGYSHATGYEVTIGPEPGDVWLEYEDNDCNRFLAR